MLHHGTQVKNKHLSQRVYSKFSLYENLLSERGRTAGAIVPFLWKGAKAWSQLNWEKGSNKVTPLREANEFGKWVLPSPTYGAWYVLGVAWRRSRQKRSQIMPNAGSVKKKKRWNNWSHCNWGEISPNYYKNCPNKVAVIPSAIPSGMSARNME